MVYVKVYVVNQYGEIMDVNEIVENFGVNLNYLESLQ